MFQTVQTIISVVLALFLTNFFKQIILIKIQVY